MPEYLASAQIVRSGSSFLGQCWQGCSICSLPRWRVHSELCSRICARMRMLAQAFANMQLPAPLSFCTSPCARIPWYGFLLHTGPCARAFWRRLVIARAGTKNFFLRPAFRAEGLPFSLPFRFLLLCCLPLLCRLIKHGSGKVLPSPKP